MEFGHLHQRASPLGRPPAPPSPPSTPCGSVFTAGVPPLCFGADPSGRLTELVLRMPLVGLFKPLMARLSTFHPLYF